MTDSVADGAPPPIACTSGNLASRIPPKKRKIVEGPRAGHEPIHFRQPELRIVSCFSMMGDELGVGKVPLRNDCKLNEKNNNGTSTFRLEELTLYDHSYCVRVSEAKAKPRSFRSKTTFVDVNVDPAPVPNENKEDGQGRTEQDPDVACEVVIETFGEEFLPFEPILRVDQPARSCLSQSEKRPPSVRKRIMFNEVTVFFFNRSQGFNVVPSSGDGFSLALDRRHSDFRRYRFSEYCVLTAQERREALLKTRTGTQQTHGVSSGCDDMAKEFLKEPTELQAPQIFDVLNEETAIQFINETPSQKYIMPVSRAKRRALLRKAGVALHICEDHENFELAANRRKCGCDCKGGCVPDKCSCALLEVSCLVDVAGYPCSCDVKSCANPYGCEWFDPVKKLPHPCPVTISEMQRRVQRDPEGICFNRS